MKVVIFIWFVVCLFTIGLNQEKDKVWVDQFDDINLGDWHGRETSFSSEYFIDTSEQNTFLCARTTSSDNFIIKKIEVDLVDYPYLNWKWRVRTLPLAGDESTKSKGDVAASINIVLRASKWRPQNIKYTWSTTLPCQSEGRSPFAIWPSRTDYIVKQCGDENLNEWITEKVNVLEAYKRLYKKTKVKKRKVEAFLIMSDSDNTKSVSGADYDDIYFSRE